MNVNDSHFEIMYREIWVKRLMIKDAHFGYFRVSELKYEEFRNFIDKFSFYFDVLSATYGKEKILGYGYFSIVASTDIFIDIAVRNSQKQKAFNYLKNTFVVLASKPYSDYQKRMPNVLDMDDVINIKRAVKDKRKALKFEFLTKINDYIVFEYEGRNYTLHSKTLKLELEKDMLIDDNKYLLQINMFESDKKITRDADDAEKELYMFCKNFL